jgi:hypothetical protein
VSDYLYGFDLTDPGAKNFLTSAARTSSKLTAVAARRAGR